jgi:hypothetical protein
MNRKHAKSLLLALQQKTMAEVAEFLTPGGGEETRTSMVRCVAALEAELQQLIAAPTPIDPPQATGDTSRCRQTLEMSL